MSITCNRCGETWKDDPALVVACPACRAPEGSPCIRPSGHKASMIHVARDQAAVDAGKLARCEGKSKG